MAEALECQPWRKAAGAPEHRDAVLRKVLPHGGLTVLKIFTFGGLMGLDSQLSQSASRMIAIQPELSFSADDEIANKLLILGLLMMASY